MQRIPFAIVEGEELPDGRILDIGALYIDDDESDRIPITWANDADSPTPIGWAHGFRRIIHEDHADVSMVIVMNTDGLQAMLDQFWIYPFCTELDEEIWDTEPKIIRHVHEARLRMLQLVPIPGATLGRSLS